MFLRLSLWSTFSSPLPVAKAKAGKEMKLYRSMYVTATIGEIRTNGSAMALNITDVTIHINRKLRHGLWSLSKPVMKNGRRNRGNDTIVEMEAAENINRSEGLP